MGITSIQVKVYSVTYLIILLEQLISSDYFRVASSFISVISDAIFGTFLHLCFVGLLAIPATSLREGRGGGLTVLGTKPAYKYRVARPSPRGCALYGNLCILLEFSTLLTNIPSFSSSLGASLTGGQQLPRSEQWGNDGRNGTKQVRVVSKPHPPLLSTTKISWLDP